MDTETARTQPVTLVIMDGFGLAPPGPGNAISQARTPNLDRYMAEYPHTELAASGGAVGLPPGEMGNSETGHMNVGAGRTVYQKLTLISRMIEDGSFFRTPAFEGAVAHVRRHNSKLHLIGLIGPGGVHAYEGHLDALLKLAHDAELREVYVQAILDGRDTEPRSALGYVRELNGRMADLGTGEIATTSGRYYAMDRDSRWERTRLAYDAMARGAGPTAASAEEAIERGYAEGVGDEYQLPTVMTRGGAPVARVEAGDAVIFFNFRGDRPRQLTKAFVLPEFDHFDRGPRIEDLYFVTLAEYEKGLPVVVAFPPERLSDPVTVPLALVVSAAGLRQLHVAETEKYAHVTYFINGGREEPFPGEDRALVPSPKEVASYNLAPAMSAAGVADAVVDGLAREDYALVIVNFANCDMVGHTGDIPATVRAVETVDTQVARVVDATLAKGGVALITADHGNAEQMLAPDGGPWTAHTSNPVPLILVAPDGASVRHVHLRDGGKLGDVGPTILALLGLDQPGEMTGTSLVASSR